MNPIMACPQCGKPTDFHEDEVEQVEDGRAICVQCGFALEEANFIIDVVAGKHPDFVENMNKEEEGEEQ